ncbi:MAG: ABC transporter permease subunit [Planctomycetaceae bacterium]|nr:ABC transporter permease subunit [Planctomycetales bacterium]MCB9926332.1 ABC transporter permease subunit [Planctomycetaceae bacterium]
MIRILIRRRINEAKWLLAACSIAMVWFCWLRVWLVSRLDTGRFKEILDLLPSDWQRYTPVDFAWLITYEGRISLAYDELVVVGCVSLWSIARGSDCVSGELGRGTLEMLLAQPLSRRAVMLSQAGVTVAGVAVLSFCAWFGTWCGIQTMSAKQMISPSIQLPFPLPFVGSEIPIPFGEPEVVYVPMVDLVDPMLFIPASVNLFTFGLMLAGFSTLMSSWDRYRWRTIGIVVGVYMLQIVLKLFGMSADELYWLKFLSAFTAYEPESLVQIAHQFPEYAWSLSVRDDEGVWQAYGPLSLYSVLASIGLACYGLALKIFSTRDLPAPL